MNETLAPVAPPQQTAAVAPPTMTPEQFQAAPGNVSLNQTVTPAVPGQSGVAGVELSYPKTPDQQYDKAINTGNANLLVNMANGPDGPAKAVADNALKVVGNNVRQYNALTNGVDPNTPAGRLTIAERFKNMNDPEVAKKNGYQTVKQNPRWGDAMMYFMAGDKANAMKLIIGGPVKEDIEYSRQSGRMLIKYTNDLGQLDRVIDAESGEIIPKDEYARQGGSVSDYNNSLKGITVKANQEQYTKDFQASTKRNNEWAANLNSTTPLYQEKLRIWQQLEKAGGLTKEQRQYWAGVASGQVSYARNLSEGQQLLDQFTRGQAQDLSASQAEKLAGEISALGRKNDIAGLRLNKDNTVTDSAGNKYNANMLKNLQGTVNVSKNIEESFSQAQANLAEQLQVGNLTSDQYKMLKAAMDIDQAIEVKNAEASKNGIPSFLRPTIAAGIVDQAHRAQIQAEQGLFNAEAMGAFEQWRDQQLKSARRVNPSYVPEPNELENAFSRTDQYKGLIDKYRERSREILNTPYTEVQKPIANQGMGTIGAKQMQSVEKPLPPPASPSSEGSAQLTREQTRARLLKEANDAVDKAKGKK